MITVNEIGGLNCRGDRFPKIGLLLILIIGLVSVVSAETLSVDSPSQDGGGYESRAGLMISVGDEDLFLKQATLISGGSDVIVRNEEAGEVLTTATSENATVNFDDPILNSNTDYSFFTNDTFSRYDASPGFPINGNLASIPYSVLSCGEGSCSETSDTRSYDFYSVTVETANFAPIFNSTKIIQSSAKTGSEVNFIVEVYDPDGDAVDVYLNLTDAEGNVEVFEGEMVDEGSGNYSYSYSLSAEPSNIGDWTLDLRVEDSNGASSSNSSSFTVSDGTVPSSQSLQDNVTETIQPGESVKISAEFRDNDSGLSQAVLATNETGSWKNYTVKDLRGWTPSETRDYTFEGASENESKYTVDLETGTYEVEVHGADGGDGQTDTGGEGGIGGYISGTFDTSIGDTLEIWVGESGGLPNGGWGRSSGGTGELYPQQGIVAGGGGGSTELLYNGEFLAAADAGGGGSQDDGAHGGGGGAGGGYGAENPFAPRTGTGSGGEGASTANAQGGDGGQDAGELFTLQEQQIGGAAQDTDGHGYVELTLLDGEEWILSDFTWQNSSFTGTLGYKIWGQDEAGNWESTDAGSFEVNSLPVVEFYSVSNAETGGKVTVDVSASDPDGDLEDVYLNLTDADGNFEVLEGFMSDDGGGDFSYTYSISSESSNVGDWTLDLRVEDTAGASSSNRSMFSVSDGTAPSSQNLQDNVSEMVRPGNLVNISAEFRDDDSGLSEAALATNESGSWVNKTSNYSSPYSFNGETRSFETLSFEWSNSSFTGFLGYKVWVVDEGGNWNKTASGVLLSNSRPEIKDVLLNWTNIGSDSESRDLEYKISDPDGSEIKGHKTPPSGSVSVSTNSTYALSGVPELFDYLASITDFKGSSTNHETNYTLNESGFHPHTSSYDLDRQRVNNTVTVENRGENLSVDLSMTGPGTLVSGGNYSGTLQRDESVSLTGVFEHDFIKGENETQVQLGQNTSKTSTVDTQFLYNQTGLEVYNDRNYSFQSVNLSSRCSITETASVPSGSSQVTSECGNESVSGDWIKNEKNSSSEYVSGTPRFGEGLNKKYTASQELEVTNVRTDFNLSVNVSSLLSQRDVCNPVNSTVQEVPKDSVQSYSIRKSCETGNETDWSPVFKTETSSFYKYEAESTIQVFNNLTENRSIEYGIPKNRLDGWGRRDPTETEVSVDGNSNDVSVSEQVFDGTEYVVVTVGDQHGNSSLHEGTHNVSLVYYESKSPGSTSGGGGSGGGSGSGSLLPEGSETIVGNVSSDRFNWTVSAITTEDTQQFSIRGYPGDSFENYIVIRNTGNRNVTLDITCTSTRDTCDWVNTSVDRVVLDRNSFTEKTVKISGRVPDTFSESDSPARFGIRVSDPRFNGSQSSDVGVEYVDFTVNYSPFLGQALDVAYKLFELREFESPVEWGNDLPYPFVFQPLFVAVVFGGGWRLLSWLNLIRELPNWRYGTSVAVFILAFILL